MKKIQTDKNTIETDSKSTIEHLHMLRIKPRQ